MSNTLDNSTIVAPATAPGLGAIAVIRLSGPKAIEICNSVFRGKDLKTVLSHTVHFGTIRDGEAILDEVLATVFKGPNSYTGEEVVEVSCHGSTFIQNQIVQLFIRKGARTANPGEFTLRAFLNGKLDLSQAEAVADLIASESEAAHELAMKQMRGGFSSEIKRLRKELIHFASLMELELDFSEEDVEFADRDDLKALLLKVHKVAQQLIESFQTGNALKNGVPVAIIGKPNVGKSTLLNALLQDDRAIVSEIAGTTRDAIEDVMNIGGIQFRFIDTAGLRDAQDTIEAIGVKKSLEKMREAAIVLFLFDLTLDKAEDATKAIIKLGADLIGNNTHVICVGTKMDLVGGHPSSTEEGHGVVAPAQAKNDIQIHNRPELKSYRKDLRNNATLAEKKLWSLLKGKQLDGRKFRRQHSIGNFILDFYCPTGKLAIELDGESHNNPEAQQRDADKEAFAAELGIKLIRFENGLVFEQTDMVLEAIKEGFTTPSQPLAEPPLLGGGMPLKETVEFIGISAKTGEGLKEMTDSLLQIVNRGDAGKEDVIVTNARHLDALTQANEALMRAYEGLNTGITGDFIAMDIRQSLHYLGEITGEITTDDLLENIFSRFCIGK